MCYPSVIDPCAAFCFCLPYLLYPYIITDIKMGIFLNGITLTFSTGGGYKILGLL